jgi:hypothetical protein
MFGKLLYSESSFAPPEMVNGAQFMYTSLLPILLYHNQANVTSPSGTDLGTE